jgi:predicted transcriptional regulator
MADQDNLIELTAEIVAAHVANNTVAVGDIATLVQQVHGALSSLGQQPEPAQVGKVPAVSVRASIKPDYIVCMECGHKQKTLKRHLMSAHGLSPDQYRSDYGLPASYPMVAPNYSEARRSMAKSIGLGRKGSGGGKSAGAATEAKPKPARRGRPRKSAG